MTAQYRTKVFVYKKKDRGEADRIFTVFSYDFGKLEIYAKGIRKIDSKLKSGIDIFFLSEIEFVQGKRKILTDALLIEKFSNISNTPEKFLIARKIAKVLDNFIKGEEHDHEIFNLIKEIFTRLNEYSPPPTSYFLQANYLYFVWNFFAILGYNPQLENCAHCHNRLDENNLFFSYKEGGALCPACVGVSKKINSDIIKIIRIILKKDWQTLQKLKINNEAQKLLNNISKNYYLYLLSLHSFKKI